MMTSILVRALPEHFASLKTQVMTNAMKKMPSFVEFQTQVLTYMTYNPVPERTNIRNVRSFEARRPTAGNKRKRKTFGNSLFLPREQFQKIIDDGSFDKWKRDRKTIYEAQENPSAPASRKIFTAMAAKYPTLYADAKCTTRARLQGAKQPTLPASTESRYSQSEYSSEESEGIAETL
jgi:hypothetical protein